MAILLDSLELPDGLIWEDEFNWVPVEQVVTPTLAGLVVEEWPHSGGGRPITLAGGRTNRTSWAWMTRTAALSLKALLDEADRQFTLTLHDARTFNVIAHRANGPALEAVPLPASGERPISNPGASSWYVVNYIRLLEFNP